MAKSLQQRWFEAFIRGTLAHPGRVLLGFLALALVGALLSSRLEFRGSFVELLPQGAREVQDLTRVSQKAGGDGYLVVRARGAEPEALRAYAAELAKRLEALQEVRYVEHRYDVEFFRDRGLLLLPAERLRALREEVEARLRYERQRLNPFYVELVESDAPPDFEAIARKYLPDAPVKEILSSADGTEVYLLVKPSGTAGDLVFAQRLVDAVRRVGEEVARGGPGWCWT